MLGLQDRIERNLPMATKPQLRAQLLSASEAAELLNVSVRTIHTWIEKDAIPYVELPRTGPKRSYRIPLQGLLMSLSGSYDLSEDIGGPTADDERERRRVRAERGDVPGADPGA
jgi:excisionase family DNA binding protein